MPEEQPEQPEQAQPQMLSLNMTPNGLVISSVVAALNEDTMQQIVVKWLETHPALLASLTKQAVEAKRNELQVIRHINAKRND